MKRRLDDDWDYVLFTTDAGPMILRKGGGPPQPLTDPALRAPLYPELDQSADEIEADPSRSEAP